MSDAGTQLKELVKSAVDNNGIIKSESEMKVVYPDGDELNIQFDLIISINNIEQIKSNQG